MKITQDTVVTFRYTVQDSQGDPVSPVDAVMHYLHGGYGEMLEKVESALQDKTIGSAVRLYLEPADAFGDYDADLLRVEPRSRFPDALETGMQFEGIPGDPASPEGLVGEPSAQAGHAGAPHIYRVTDIAGDSVVLDGNHPLAGMALRFIATVTEVRAATQDEIEAGQSDGAAGGLMLAAASSRLH
jgi:FKBP-type peptidyl-prolyl cis-trans isomerase SlyD